MAIGFSSAVSRLFRSLHRSKHAAGAESPRDSAGSCVSPSSLVLLASGTAIALPTTIDLPRGFTRHVRHLVDCVSLLPKLRLAAAKSTRRHAAIVKALDRVASELHERNADDGASTRAVPLNAAVELLLIVWECVLQCIEIQKSAPPSSSTSSVSDRLSTCSSTSSSPPDDATRLDVSARALLALLIQQQEFDLALVALGRGDCNVHRNDGARRRPTQENAARPEREEPRLSRRNSRNSRNTRLSRRGSVTTKRPMLPRPMPSKRDVSSSSDASLCQLAKKYLDLHQITLRLMQDACSRFSMEAAVETNDKTSDRALLMQFLAVSYVRVPVLRGAILSAFQQSLEGNNGRRRQLQGRPVRVTRSQSSLSSFSAADLRSRSGTLMGDVNVALFRWTQSLHPKCHGNVAPLHRETMWSKETMQLSLSMADPKFQRVLIAKLIDHFLMLGGNNATMDWKCLPGAALLKEVVLTMTESVFQSQLHAIELSMIEKEVAATDAGGAEGSTLKESGLGQQSFSLSTPDDWTVGIFFKQTMRMLASNTPLLYEWLMTVLQNTNYMVSFNVTLCLRYLGQLMTQFPAYFAEDSSVSATETLLVKVFSTLLKSEHFEVLRNTEMFLMKHFAGFSISLREALVEVFAGEFKRLFLHWNRDVRFCYYHMLLYLTYPGNRLVLGAKSDELMMGAAAAQLFEIPGLIRHSSHMSAKWDAFDEPLCELISHVNRLTKNSRSPVRPTATTQQPRSQPSASTTRASLSTTRTSMTLRPKPAGRASLMARPSHARASLTSNPYAPAPQRNSTSTMPKAASMSALPVALAIAPPPPVPAWIQPLSLTTMQRSVQEYRRHVETYFDMARRISVHEAVPTPTLQAAAKA